ncbi:MAG: calpain family cysteine protease, partial [archaeon]|nr:calpain family cysteine protease [archaeon]
MKKNEKAMFFGSAIAKSLLGQNYNEINKGKDKFEDQFFPPDDGSLYSSKSEIEKYKQPDIPKFLLQTNQNKFLSQFALTKKDRNYSWQRLSEMYDISKLNVCKETKGDEEGLIKDVLQGELGDCYFLSAISALGENPSRIKALFPNQKISNKGVFEAVVYLHGEPTPIVVDDYFPIIDKEGYEPQLAFAGLNEKSFNVWPMVLEKIWAKVNNSYEDIIAGNSADAFEFLSPAPIDTYHHNADTSTLFDLIKEADEKGFIIVSDITETQNTNLDNLSKMGLITNHAYTIVGTAVLKEDDNKNQIRLIKIRNVWGTNEWLGDWSDGSRLWTEEYKKKVGLVQKEDGIFWMSFEDFLKFYTCTHICRIHDDYKFISQKFEVSKENPFTIVTINVPKDTSGYFEVNLKNQRIYSSLKGIPDFENPYTHLTVFYKDGDEITFIGGDNGRHNRLYVECENIKKGTYYVAVSFPKQSKDVKINYDYEFQDFKKMSYRIGIYSPLDKITMKGITEEEFEELKNFMDDIITDLALKDEEKYYLVKEGAKDAFRVIHFDSEKNGFGYIYYDNTSDAFIKEQMNICELINVNVLPILREGEFQKLDLTTDQEIEFEDPNIQKDIDTYRGNTKLKSSIEVIQPVKKYEDISEDNPLILQLSIAPHSKGMIILQKTEEDSSLDFTSNICLDYLIDTLVSGRIFNSKRFMLKYNDKPVDIYEIVTEHNTGTLFQ